MMGVIWFIELVSFTVENSFILHLLTVLNCFQGIIIFILFICKPQVKQLIAKRFRIFKRILFHWNLKEFFACQGCQEKKVFHPTNHEPFYQTLSQPISLVLFQHNHLLLKKWKPMLYKWKNALKWNLWWKIRVTSIALKSKTKLTPRLSGLNSFAYKKDQEKWFMKWFMKWLEQIAKDVK